MKEPVDVLLFEVFVFLFSLAYRPRGLERSTASIKLSTF